MPVFRSSKDGHNDKCPEINLVAHMSKNTILVNVLGQKTSALVDSGAAVTIISKQFFEKTAFNGSKLQTPNFPNVVGASGRR